MRMWRRVRAGACALTVTVALLAIASPAIAQTYQGGVRGAVKDSTGVIPGVDVTLTNEETNAVRTTQTNGSGDYAFANVLPWPYTINVAMPGFKTEERKGLRIATQQQVQLDFTLEVGAISELLTVTAEAPLVERATASRATTMTADEINALPIFGRNTFYTWIATPNVVQTGDPLFVRYQDQSGSSLLSMGGGPRRGNAYLLEGVSLTDFSNRAAWVPSAEALSDMRVQVKTCDAEMGRAAGGAFNVTARSGSNQKHGSALFLNKPGWGTGNLFFAKRAGLPIPSNGRGLQTSSILNDGPQNQETIKIDHRWSDRMTTTGMYGHQYTKEPGTANQGPFGTIPSDSGASLLERPVHFFAFNHIMVPNNSTTLTFRYGYNNFGNRTSYPGARDFDPATLGLPGYFTERLSATAFPAATIAEYQTIGHGGQSASTLISETFNGTLTKLMGSHSIKMGADYRRIRLQDFPGINGSFTYSEGYTQLNATTVSTTAGDALASFLLGLPSAASYTVDTPNEYTVDYVSGYVQDDWRISSTVTSNFGLRYEYDPGVRALNNQFITDFAFDQPFPIQVPD